MVFSNKFVVTSSCVVSQRECDAPRRALDSGGCGFLAIFGGTLSSILSVVIGLNSWLGCVVYVVV